MTRAVVGAVIVTFHPDVDQLLRSLEVLGPQVAHTVLVDNTPGAGALAQLSLPATVELLSLGTNAGIAEGFNIGIRHLHAHGCEHFFLSDQDSTPAPDIIAELLAAYDALDRAGHKVAAVGSMFVDPRDGSLRGFSVYDWRGSHFRTEPDATGYVPASFLISSGSLIPRAVIDAIGPMDAGLFIDLVDIEWCYRAVARGFEIYGAPAARMQHVIGDQLVELAPAWVVARKRPVHAPFRLYFQARNTLLLCWMRHVPLHWKLWNLLNIVGKAYLYLVRLRSQRSEYWRNLRLGAWHGLRAKKGGHP